MRWSPGRTPRVQSPAVLLSLETSTVMNVVSATIPAVVGLLLRSPARGRASLIAKISAEFVRNLSRTVKNHFIPVECPDVANFAWWQRYKLAVLCITLATAVRLTVVSTFSSGEFFPRNDRVCSAPNWDPTFLFNGSFRNDCVTL